MNIKHPQGVSNAIFVQVNAGWISRYSDCHAIRPFLDRVLVKNYSSEVSLHETKYSGMTQVKCLKYSI